MANVTIDSAIGASAYGYDGKRYIVWTDENTVYVFGLDLSSTLAYWKSTDAGATWGAAVLIESTESCYGFDIWYDGWTSASDTGTKIHIVYFNSIDSKAKYNALDTSDDSLDGVGTPFASGLLSRLTTSRLGINVSITKSRAGNLYVAETTMNGTNTTTTCRFAKYSAGSWDETLDVSYTLQTTKMSYTILLPGNETDTDDIWNIVWDTDGHTVDLFVYDQSGDSWSSAQISSRGTDNVNSNQIAAIQRVSDNHAILAFWNDYNSATGDLNVYDITSAATITAKTDVVSNIANVGVGLLINQQTNELYCCYFKGTYATAVDVYYKYSDNGGATWGAEVKFNDLSLSQNWKLLDAGSSIKNGGAFMPVWTDDTSDDLITNAANAVAIPVRTMKVRGVCAY